MALYSIELTSSTPMMFNKMSEETLHTLIYGKSSDKKKLNETRTLEQIAEGNLHKDNEGNPLLPLSGVMQAFAKAAGSFSKKKGRGSMRALAAGAFRIQHEYAQLFCPQTGDVAKWHVDFRRGVNANAGAGTAVALVRPKFESWKASFDVAIDLDLIDESLAVEILNYAGRTVGLGAWRFEKLGPCGGFFVSSIKKQD